MGQNSYLYRMTEEFIRKRIKEQYDYIEKVLKSNIPADRMELMVETAQGQKKYFEEKLKQLKNK